MSDAARIERLPGMPGGAASRLFDDYVRGDAALDPFFGRRVRTAADFAPPPREGSLLDTAGRRALVEALLSSPGRIDGARAQEEAIAALAEEPTLAVVTGQQPGLFLGPLLTLYKAVATVALARQLEARYRRRVVPVFWLVAEDDDFSEISETRLVDAAGATHAITLDADGDEKRTYASLRAGPSLESAGARVAALLSADGAHSRGETIAAAVCAAAREFTPVRAFARLLGSLLADRGLVILDPSDARIKALAAPFVRRELEQPLASSRGAREAGARLEALGYHAQICIDEDRPALFEVQGGRRTRIAAAEGPDGRGAGAPAALVETIAPGVLIRPAYQDYLLPTVAYVGGPAEVAYLAQLGETYERHGVPRPIVVPRLAAILAEPDVARFLDRDAPDLALLREAPAQLAAAVDPAAPAPAEIAALHTPLAALDEALARLGEALAAQAPPSAAMVEGARTKIRREIERVAQSAGKQLDRERETQRRRVARVRARLFPDGRLQERVLSPLPFLARWPGLVDALVNAYDPLDARPLLVRLAGRSPNPPDPGGEALA